MLPRGWKLFRTCADKLSCFNALCYRWCLVAFEGPSKVVCLVFVARSRGRAVARECAQSNKKRSNAISMWKRTLLSSLRTPSSFSILLTKLSTTKTRFSMEPASLWARSDVYSLFKYTSLYLDHHSCKSPPCLWRWSRCRDRIDWLIDDIRREANRKKKEKSLVKYHYCSVQAKIIPS